MDTEFLFINLILFVPRLYFELNYIDILDVIINALNLLNALDLAISLRWLFTFSLSSLILLKYLLFEISAHVLLNIICLDL